MVKVYDMIDPDLLSEQIVMGNISVREHNELPYAIYNYTPQAAYSRDWNDATKKCRGLIVNLDTMDVIARPFEKFFNWDEAGSSFPPAGPALRMEKADGSLGILYPIYEEKWNGGKGGKFVVDHAIATRGSMHSEQAEWATNFYRNYMDDKEMELATLIGKGVPFTENFMPRPDKTYLFEIIYPENRIVVDYGDYKGLILLDVIDNETGFSDTDEFDDCNWPDKIVRRMVPGFDSGQVVDIREGEEGFVYLWPTRNFRTKMKSEEYIRIHRLVSNLSEKSVWESLVAGRTVDQIKIGLPEEFHGFIDGVVKNISYKVTGILAQAYAAYHIALDSLDVDENGKVDRGEFARLVKDDPMRKYLFLILDGKGIYPVALRDAKPVRNDPLVKSE